MLADGALITDLDSGDEDLELGEQFREEREEDDSEEYESEDNIPLAATRPRPRLTFEPLRPRSLTTVTHNIGIA